jgi:O-methyltransferase
MSIGRRVRTVIKDLALSTGAYNRTFFNVYPFMFAPHQLTVLDQAVRDVRDIPGCFVEAGCAFGASTVFLRKSMQYYGINAPYYAIDTFSGFVKEQVAHETEKRGKPQFIAGEFSENKQAWFDRSIALHEIDGVTSIKSDVTKFDFSSLGPIAFCLLDVDIYLPMKDALPKIYDALAPGGILVIDDCEANVLYDGAQQAFEEFIAERGLQRNVVAEKIGLLTK